VRFRIAKVQNIFYIRLLKSLKNLFFSFIMLNFALDNSKYLLSILCLIVGLILTNKKDRDKEDKDNSTNNN